MTSTNPGRRARLDRPLLVSLQYKLGAIVLVVTVFAIALFGSALLRHVEQTEYEEASGHLLGVGRQVRSMLAVHHALMVVAVERHQAAFGARFDGPFHLDATSSVHLDGHHVPQLKIGRQTIGHDFPAVDQFTEGSLGHAATVFVRHGDDFLRIATSLRDDTGERVVGTLLGRDHPAAAPLRRGEPHTGPAELFGRAYMTSYRPLLDASGSVIGALFVGLDMSTEFARIKREIAEVRVGRNGYVYVLDARPGDAYGRFIVHPEHEGRDVLALADPEARSFFTRILAGGDGTVGRYPYRASNGKLHDKIVGVATFPEWQWVIGAGAYYEEFAEQSRRLQFAVFGALVVAGIAIILALKASIRRLVLVPLLEMHETVRASEARFRALVTSSDDLIYTTDGDGRLTAVYDKGLVSSPDAIGALIGRPVAALLGAADAQHETMHTRSLAGGHVVYDWSAEGPKGHVDVQSSLAPMHDADGRVSGLVCIARDITERRRAEALTAHLAQHDALTGLPNRALMQDRLQQAIAHAERHGTLVGLLFVDLDHFKAVNDEHGHEAGDQLLQAVAERLLGCVRQADTVARIGGDEFVVVIGDAGDDSALVQVAEKLLAAFSRPFVLSACTLPMTASVGLSSYPADGTEAVQLLKGADAAMYRAKGAGRAAFRCSGAASRPAPGCPSPS